MDALTVGDELVYDALPDDIRKICDKKIAAAKEDDDDAYQRGFDAGEKSAERDADEKRLKLVEEIDRLTERVEEQDNQIVALGREVSLTRAALDLARKAKS